MANLLHPSKLLKQDKVSIIRECAQKAEQQGRLMPEQLAVIYEEQWFKILIPSVYGGLQLSLPDAIRIEEAISWMDGSTGWVVTLCAGAGWFGGFIAPSFAKEIYQSPIVCLAGSGAPTGTAEIKNKGYIVNGKWLHASGAPNATVFTANCIVTENGKAIKDNNGDELILSFAFLKDEVAVINTWNCMGMKATASHAYQVVNLFVPNERQFRINKDFAQIKAPLYQYPFLQLAETTLAANISGMAIHFIDLCETLFNNKKDRNGVAIIHNKYVNNSLQGVKNKLTRTRLQMYENIENSWQHCISENEIPDNILTMVSNSAYMLSDTARQSVEELFPYCGLIAANPDTEINRVWRDLHTATQHTLLALKDHS